MVFVSTGQVVVILRLIFGGALMKKIMTFALAAILLTWVGWTPAASAATEAQKLAAILLGDTHLDTIQCNTAGSNFGSWSTSGCSGSYTDALTGAAVYAFLTRSEERRVGKECR